MICVAGLLVTSVARTHAFIPGADLIRPGLIFSVLALLVWLFDRKWVRSIKAIKHPLAYLALFIVLWAVVGIPTALYRSHALLYLLDNFSRVIITFLIIAVAVRDVHDVRRLLFLYALGAIIYSIFAITPGVDRGVRAGGYDPNDAAMFIVSGISLVLYFALRVNSLVVKAMLVAGLVACCVALVASESRGGFLALIALAIYILFFNKVLSRTVRVVAVLLVVGGLLGTGSESFWDRMESITDENDYNRHSITGRKQLWTRSVEYMLANPVFGVGLYNFSVAEGRHPLIRAQIESGRGVRYGVAHSIWLEIGAELGIPGFVAFIGIFIFSFVYLTIYGRSARNPRAPPGVRDAAEIAGALVGILLVLAVAGTFLSNQYHSLIWGPFALILGFLKVAPHVDSGRGAIDEGSLMSPHMAALKARRQVFRRSW